MEHTERLFSPKELAALAGVSAMTIRREVARGRLLGIQVGDRHIRIPESAWREYVQRGANDSHRKPSGR